MEKKQFSAVKGVGTDGTQRIIVSDSGADTHTHTQHGHDRTAMAFFICRQCKQIHSLSFAAMQASGRYLKLCGVCER